VASVSEGFSWLTSADVCMAEKNRSDRRPQNQEGRLETKPTAAAAAAAWGTVCLP